MRRRVEPAELQELELGLVASLNRRHLKGRESDPSLAARMKSMETAFGMQQEAPEVFDLSKETEATHTLYDWKAVRRPALPGSAWWRED
jgi:hypothetical protein